MKNSLVFDTNAIVNYLKDPLGAEKFFRVMAKANRKVSVITKVELFIFPTITPEEEAAILTFLADCVIIPMNNEIENIAIQLGRSAKLKAPDAIIAATAVAEKSVLVTDDLRLLNINWPGFSARSLFRMPG